jgi:AcrR family transcriptional regulator
MAFRRGLLIGGTDNMSIHSLSQLALLIGKGMPAKPLTKPRKVPSQTRSAATVETIIEAAARVLIKRGMGGFNTNAVAAEAGVSVGSLYQYFPGKEAILVEINRRHAVETAEPIVRGLAASKDMPLHAVVSMVVVAFVDAHRSRPDLHRVLIDESVNWGPQLWRDDLRAIVRKSIQSALVDHRQSIVVRDLAMMVFMLEHVVESTVHAAARTAPNSLRDGSLARELEVLLLSYLTAGTCRRP